MPDRFFYVWWWDGRMFHHYRTESMNTALECVGLLMVLGFRGVQVRAGSLEVAA